MTAFDSRSEGSLGEVDHVAVLVTDIDDSVDSFRDLLGKDPISDETLIDPPVRLLHFDCGNVELQLVQPTGAGRLADDLVRVGEGLHHVCFRVDSIDSAQTRMGSAERVFTGGRGRAACFLGNRPSGLYVELIEAPSSRPDALAEVLEVSDAYWAAESARDMTTMLAYFTEDAEVENQDAHAVGHAAIAAMYQASFDKFPGLEVRISGAYAGDTDHGVAFDAVLTDTANDRWRVQGVNTVALEGGRIKRLRSFEDRPTPIERG